MTIFRNEVTIEFGKVYRWKHRELIYRRFCLVIITNDATDSEFDYSGYHINDDFPKYELDFLHVYKDELSEPSKLDLLFYG